MSLPGIYLPRHAQVKDGVLQVPPGYPPYCQADLEAIFRHLLWPPLAPGYVRFARRLRWLSNGAALKFRIVDVPKSANVA